jgi:octaprenyl-diphosphate synthase
MEPFLERVAEQLMAQADEFEPQIVAYAQYALTAQGKQLRPVLVGLSGEAAGGLNNSHLTVAVIIEMVHLATLVHDDIIDEADCGGASQVWRPIGGRRFRCCWGIACWPTP